MEKKPHHVVIVPEELWFHRPTWSEHPPAPSDAHTRTQERLPDSYRILIVDDENRSEDVNEAELFMMHNRVVRSNRAALNTLADFNEEIQEYYPTPIGFEYPDIVMERKFFISKTIILV